MTRHVDELAELYALGSLENEERASVERHVRTCPDCADRIRVAEATIACISDLEQHHEPPERISEHFAARLATARAAQKELSLKVITSVIVSGMMILGLSGAVIR